MNIINSLIVLILILLTAFFVATEFAIVKVRSTRIDQLVDEGNKKAKAARKLLDNLDGALSACQLGITITALGLGWIGEKTVQALLGPIFDVMNLNDSITTILSFAISFSVITYLHVVVGELAPKTIAIQKAEQIIMLLGKPLLIFYKIAYPFIWLLNGSAHLFIRLFGFKPMSEGEVAHSEEELRLILSESYESGEINQSEMMYVNNIFEFDERSAKEIMIPRTEMICLYTEDTYEENLQVIKSGQFTRYPVAEDDKDHILGLVNLKEIFTAHIKQDLDSINSHIRPILHVSESTPIKQVLLKMQKERIHMAIVMDEYGGTAGILTVEDILEEIVGEIRDEFDSEEILEIENLDSKTTIVSGKLLLTEMNEQFGTHFENEEVDTIGGWILMQEIEPKLGTTLHHEQYEIIVNEIDGFQIKKVKITRVE